MIEVKVSVAERIQRDAVRSFGERIAAVVKDPGDRADIIAAGELLVLETRRAYREEVIAILISAGVL